MFSIQANTTRSDFDIARWVLTKICMEHREVFSSRCQYCCSSRPRSRLFAAHTRADTGGLTGYRTSNWGNLIELEDVIRIRIQNSIVSINTPDLQRNILRSMERSLLSNCSFHWANGMIAVHDQALYVQGRTIHIPPCAPNQYRVLFMVHHAAG